MSDGTAGSNVGFLPTTMNKIMGVYQRQLLREWERIGTIMGIVNNDDQGVIVTLSTKCIEAAVINLAA